MKNLLCFSSPYILRRCCNQLNFTFIKGHVYSLALSGTKKVKEFFDKIGSLDKDSICNYSNDFKFIF